MKVLLVGLERVGKLFSMESLFKKKLTEADMTDVEVVTAEMAEFGSPGGRKLERSMNEALRDEADFVVVMEPWQKDLLTRFMDYRNWHKIHLFADICKQMNFVPITIIHKASQQIFLPRLHYYYEVGFIT